MEKWKQKNRKLDQDWKRVTTNDKQNRNLVIAADTEGETMRKEMMCCSKAMKQKKCHKTKTEHNEQTNWEPLAWKVIWQEITNN